MFATASDVVQGQVSRGFESVRDAFEDNFARHRELGGACCAYYGGKKVVDIWGGVRDKHSGKPWPSGAIYSAGSALCNLMGVLWSVCSLLRFFPIPHKILRSSLAIV